jgi:hypothetical protein
MSKHEMYRTDINFEAMRNILLSMRLKDHPHQEGWICGRCALLGRCCGVLDCGTFLSKFSRLLVLGCCLLSKLLLILRLSLERLTTGV